MIRQLFFLLAFLPLLSWGQTAEWIRKPHYSSITPYAEGLLKVKLHSKAGIIDMEGNEIVPVSADSITSMTEGQGLVLKMEEGRYRLLGLVNKSGKMLPILSELYVGEYPFFSEGKLPVCNKKGQYGFIDVAGRLILKHNYGSVHPFCEGWAVVTKKGGLLGTIASQGGLVNNTRTKKFYVNASGQFLTLQSDIGDVYLATSFRNGEALVVSKDNRNYIINTSGNIIRIENSVTMAFDKKYGLKNPDEPEIEDLGDVWEPTYSGPKVFKEGDYFGYRLNGKVILPAQFTDAKDFVDGYAIAARYGYYGMLKLQDGSFDIRPSKSTLKPESADEEAVDYHVTVPQCWQNEKLYLHLAKENDDTKKSFATAGNGESVRVFETIAFKGDKLISIETADLCLWNNISKKEVKKVSQTGPVVTISCWPLNEVTANEKDIAQVNVILQNTTSEAQTVTVLMSGRNLTSSQRKVVDIEPDDKVVLPAFFGGVTQKFDSRKLSVTVLSSDGTIINKFDRNIKFNPFFVED